MVKNILQKVNNYIQGIYDNDEYNWIHNNYVTKYALILGKRLNADLEILEISARFHDCNYSRGRDWHAQDSAQVAKEFLLKEGYPQDKTDIVVKIILCHRKQLLKEMSSPPIEGKILNDADVMWRLTPSGIARLIAHRYKKNTSYKFIVDLISKDLKKYDKLNFDISKELVKGDYEVCRVFLKKMITE